MKKKEAMQEVCERLERLSSAFKGGPVAEELKEILSLCKGELLPYFERLGRAKTEAKAKASRANGAKGGRPARNIGRAQYMFRKASREYNERKAKVDALLKAHEGNVETLNAAEKRLFDEVKELEKKLGAAASKL